jgi:tRNA(fMet)-specific endonuclease VapC
MKYLLDTDIFAHALRGQAAVRRQLLAIEPADVAISIITLAELYYGASLSAQVVVNMQAINDFVGAINVLNLEPAIVQDFGAMKALLRRQGQLIADFDLLIATTSRVHGLSLVTNNERHFRRVPSVQLVNWLSV